MSVRRRSWWPAATSAWSCRSRRSRWSRSEHPGRPRAQQAGDRGDPDARVDDHELPADPRRGLRRRQRRAGRRRRGDALRGDLGRASTRSAPSGRWRGSSTPSRATRCRCPDASRTLRGPRSGAIVRAAKDVGEALDVKALAAFTQTGETVRRLAALHPRLPLLAFTADAAGAQPAGAVLGRGDVPGAVGRAHRRHVRAGRLRAAVHRPAQGRRPRGRRGRQPAERRGSTNLSACTKWAPLVTSGGRTARTAGRGAPGGPGPARSATPTCSSGRRPRTAAAADLRRPGGRPGADGGRPDRARERAGALPALVLPAAGRPARGDPLRGRADPGRPVVLHAAGASPGSSARARTSRSSR